MSSLTTRERRRPWGSSSRAGRCTRWDSIPAEVPTEFGGAGRPEDYQTKSSLWGMLIVGWLFSAALAVIGRVPALWKKNGGFVRVSRLRIGGVAIGPNWLNMDLMSLLVALLFSYLSICSALCRPLGAWFMPVFFAVLMYAYPESGLKAAAAERTRRFTRDLPGALDVMRLVAQSGGDLLSAIRAVIDVMPGGPVRDELSRVVAEVTIGTSLSVALNNVAARIGTNEANAVFSTLAQSLEMGTSVAENLQSAAQLIRHAARVKAQTQAQKAVVNMSFPLLLLILPGIFIVLFAPLVIQFINR